MKEKIRIASGQGFWGDLIDAPVKQASGGPVDYIMMDYLAEVTMSILQKQKLKDPNLGYARDIPVLMNRLLPLIKEKGFKVITNGGGVNPIACRDAVFAVAKKLGIKDLKIGVVLGDNILDNIDSLISKGVELKNMESGESVKTVRDKILSANVYLGAAGVVEALKQGADIVLTGRVTDTGLTLAPMIHEFGWDMNNFDLMAAGTVAGHILECGGQASGGNFLGDWRSVSDMARIGFPIAEAFPNGEVIITKHENTGGLVSVETVSEQLVYEIGDPKDYITPDCIADFTSIHLEQVGENRVRVHGVKGLPATPFYKVSMSYLDGYSAFGSLTYCWPDALDKAKAADEILRTRLSDLGLKFDEVRSEFQGYNACHGPIANKIDDPNEVVLRIGVRSQDKKAIERFGMEIAPLILTGPPGVTGFAGGRPKPSEVVAYWPALIPKKEVEYKVVVEGL
ncbi:MAG TPA: acyclic terpene utilization AtuA family protein [Ignavibacteria bacterium]|nr:acyclic terpene utilization AtuA family protein [Ignavibacteria bacterium]